MKNLFMLEIGPDITSECFRVETDASLEDIREALFACRKKQELMCFLSVGTTKSFTIQFSTNLRIWVMCFLLSCFGAQQERICLMPKQWKMSQRYFSISSCFCFIRQIRSCILLACPKISRTFFGMDRTRMDISVRELAMV